MFAARVALRSSHTLAIRHASTSASKDKYKIVVVGAGAGGLAIANQIYSRFKAAGKSLNDGDIAIVDGAEYHNYQPGWTLVGSGLKDKEELRRPTASLIDSHLTHITENIKSFSPDSSSITTTSGRNVGYDTLVVAAGIKTNWNAISGLPEALKDARSGVSSIFGYDTCDKTWRDIDALQGGRAIFTQPAGVIKCAGAPQKIMWMAWDRYRRTGRSDKVNVEFFNGMPSMFSVKKYSDALEKLRQERGVQAQFQHNLSSIDVGARKATFKKADGSSVTESYDLLHVVPPMGPLDFIKSSPLADGAGWVDVDSATLRHKRFDNVWAIGDCSSLPTSKTAAAITAQAPVLTENLFSVIDTGKLAGAQYDGYTSCPLLTGYDQLMLAEFKYGLVPKESFGDFLDQSKPNRAFYHLKKDFFPWVYYAAMLKGTWFGANGPVRPSFIPA